MACKSMKVSEEFRELVRDYRQRFESKHGIKVSSDSEATKVIATKIKNIGGLKV